MPREIYAQLQRHQYCALAKSISISRWMSPDEPPSPRKMRCIAPFVPPHEMHFHRPTIPKWRPLSQTPKPCGTVPLVRNRLPSHDLKHPSRTLSHFLGITAGWYSPWFAQVESGRWSILPDDDKTPRISPAQFPINAKILAGTTAQKKKPRLRSGLRF